MKCGLLSLCAVANVLSRLVSCTQRTLHSNICSRQTRNQGALDPPLENVLDTV